MTNKQGHESRVRYVCSSPLKLSHHYSDDWHYGGHCIKLFAVPNHAITSKATFEEDPFDGQILLQECSFPFDEISAKHTKNIYLEDRTQHLFYKRLELILKSRTMLPNALTLYSMDVN